MRWSVALILLLLLATTAVVNPPVRGGGPVPAPPVEANCVPADPAERLRALLPAAAPADAAPATPPPAAPPAPQSTPSN